MLLLLLPVFLTAQSPGTLDSTFNNNGILLTKVQGEYTSFQSTEYLPDGKIMVVGYIRYNDDVHQTVVGRLLNSGVPDSTFNEDGFFILNEGYNYGRNCHLLPDGKLLVLSQGIYPNMTMFLRLDASGNLDETFGDNGVVKKFSDIPNENVFKSFLQPDGKIVTIGIYPTFGQWRAYASRFLPNGDFDTDFDINGLAVIPEANTAVEVDVRDGGIAPDGKIVMVGSIGSSSANEEWYLVRLMPNGTPDPTFGTNGISKINVGNNFSEGAHSILFLNDGKMIVGGHAQKYPGYHFTMLRINDDGTQDMTYGLGGKAQIGMECCYSLIYDLKQQADGKILACGYASEDNDHYNYALARFKPNGAVDQTFGSSGRVILKFEADPSSQRAVEMALQPDGKIIAAGYTDYGSFWGIGVVTRMHPGPVTVDTETPIDNMVEGVDLNPNPVTGDEFQIGYTLLNDSEISIAVFDLMGRRITSPASVWQPAGDHQTTVNLPAHLSAGAYFLQIETATGVQSIKFIKM